MEIDMSNSQLDRNWRLPTLIALALMLLSGCANQKATETTSTPPSLTASSEPVYEYEIGPGDVLNVFVWRNADVSVNGIPVRPDGKITIPLVEDLVVIGKSPNQVAREIESLLSKYIQEPKVTVTVINFSGGYAKQVRVVGEASQPQALAFRQGMTLLDLMITVGGLTEFAAGNKAHIVRTMTDGTQQTINVRISDLLDKGDITANMQIQPGDILIIPESWF